MNLKNIFRGFGRKRKKEQQGAPPKVERADPNAWPEPDTAGMDGGEAWPEPDAAIGAGTGETWPDADAGAKETWPDADQGAEAGTTETWPDTEPAAGESEATAWPDADTDAAADEATAWPDANAAEDAGEAAAWPENGADIGEAAAWPEETTSGEDSGEGAWPSGEDPGAAWPSEGGAAEPPAEEEDGKKGKKKKKPKKEKKPKKKKKGGDDADEGDEGGKMKKPKLLLIIIPAVVVAAAAAAVLLILKPWAPKEPKAEEPEIVAEEPTEEPTEEPAAEATAADLTPVQPAPPPVTDTAGAMDHFAALNPSSLGLEGESMAEYRYYATGKTITVDGVKCREIMVYSVSESAGTNDVEGRYFLSMDTKKLFRDNGADGVEELSPSIIGIGE